MHAAEAIRRLHKERIDWRQAKASGAGPEVSWTLNGIELAIRIIKSLAREQHKQNLIQRPRLYRYIASDMFRAMNTALNQIKRGEPSRAAFELERQIERIRQEGVSNANKIDL